MAWSDTNNDEVTSKSKYLVQLDFCNHWKIKQEVEYITELAASIMSAFKLLILLSYLAVFSIAWVSMPKTIEEVSIKQLIENKRKYQGKMVKTRGCFLERFEERALYSQCNIERNTKESIWIVFSAKTKTKFNPDSIST